MSDDEHWRRLERMYVAAPTNDYYRPTIRIGEGTCEIVVMARPDFHHAASAVHGAVYFKILDDAGFFAANSAVRDALVLTANFTIHLLRPVAEGALTGRGRLLSAGSRQLLAEAQLYNARDQLIAHGIGTYVRSRIALDESVGYVRRDEG